MDWIKWHEGYDFSPARRARLQLVQEHITACLEACDSGAIRVISVCAGDARDLIGVLPRHPRRADVSAYVVETNPELLERARRAADKAEVAPHLCFVAADATLASTYLDFAPADLVILSGVLGNLRHGEVPSLVEALRSLCRTHGFVVWTRHRYGRDGARQVPRIRRFLRKVGFEEAVFDVTLPGAYAVATHLYCGVPLTLAQGERLFEFSGLDDV